jgi:nickel superoxide dismutase
VGLFQPTRVAHAHCDLFCAVYDPAQAMIEATSVLNACKKYQASDDEVFRTRCIIIKEERAELVKHHLWVLWTDFFKPPHIEQFPQIHDLIWRATKQAGEAKKSMDPEVSQKLIDLIQEVSDIFWQTEASASAGVYPPS